ncbi:uncharacterized HhH-GPD family protein [Jatrophihabitans sp. GAS493]|uniref:HhH-GPD-type base excision DNA repair protein n=1 Tax=Jatrophihabitans sp. GAS493 TaxID=1907575 RepID=UPI000BB93494|nr:HhH-GPD-type base excision DNA repair protein [Jatrophihabitans sp. GAS493]SOD71065.1 uncharacterized HhH-GPD family protein [Jatrophihabitans sp. GAS493]
MYLATTDEGNALLERDPLALLIGMLLDQQIPMEKAFTSPSVLAERMGSVTLDAREIAACDPERFEEIFRQTPALHRFPAAMAKRVQALAEILVADYDGNAQRVWAGVRDGDELVARIGTLPGFGDQKARIFAALLGKQFGIQPPGWRAAAGAYGEEGSQRSVADVTDAKSLQAVRATKQAAKQALKQAAMQPAD